MIVLVIMVFIVSVSFYLGYLYGRNSEKLLHASEAYYLSEIDFYKTKYTETVEKHNELVGAYNSLLNDYNNLLQTKQNYGNFETLYFTGNSIGTVPEINIPAGTYYITVTHYGSKNCQAFIYRDENDTSPELIANLDDAGDESFCFEGALDNGYINVYADGDWRIIIEKSE